MNWTTCECQKCDTPCPGQQTCSTSAGLAVCVLCFRGIHNIKEGTNAEDLEELDNCRKD